MPNTAQKLANLLVTDPALNNLAETGDAAGILTAINLRDRKRTNSIEQTNRAVPLYFQAKMGEAGLLYANIVCAVLEGVLQTTSFELALPRSMLKQFESGNGLDLSLPDVQSMITQLFASGSVQIGVDGGGQPIMLAFSTVGEAFKQMGVWYESLADQEFGEVATEQHVTDALALYARRKLEVKVTQRYNETLARVLDGSVVSWDAARSLLGAE